MRTIDIPVHTHHVTVSSAKGGVGKTTTSVALGTVFAMHRRDQCIVVDANPDMGTLHLRITDDRTPATIRDLLAHLHEIHGANDFRRFVSQATSRLEALTSDQDPARRALSPAEYQTLLSVVDAFRQVIITDTGIDLTNPIMDAIVDATDTLVVAASTAVDEADIAWETLDTYASKSARGAVLVPNAVVALTMKNGERQYPVEQLVNGFLSRCRAVVQIPHDPHLSKGTVFDWAALQAPTQRAYLELAAAVASGFTRTRH